MLREGLFENGGETHDVRFPCLQAAGGTTFDGMGSVLDSQISSTEAKSICAMGSTDLVERTVPAMQESLKLQGKQQQEQQKQ
jgi:hypothetical protein